MYAGSVFKDTVGKTMAAKGDLNQGLLEWQKRIVDYGKQQGIDVTTP
jgi:multiple sugar transport system substrate-binding protein